MTRSDAEAVAGEYIDVIDSLYGVYLDGGMGFGLVVRQFGQVSSPDEARMTFSSTPPDDPATKVQHQCTVGDIRRRNQPHGSNSLFLANAVLVTLYQYWEDHFRQAMASALGLASKNGLKAPVMGDLRRLRQSILHHRGIAKPEIASCELLRWFQPGDMIELTDRQFEQLVDELKAAVRTMAQIGA